MPLLKDYYRILNISPAASAEEIRKAFRKLALVYHPDKNPNPGSTLERYAEIQEAYQVLGNRKTRAEYQIQWYAMHPESQRQYMASNTAELLAMSRKLAKETVLADPFRINRDQLFFSISSLISPHNREILENDDNPPAMHEFVGHILDCAGLLELEMSKEIVELLNPLAGKDKAINHQTRLFAKHAQRSHYWEKYKILAALAVTILLCLYMYKAIR